MNTPAETTNSREREPSVIPGKYEHINLRHAVESYDRHGGKVNAAVMRALNYAVMRLNERAVRRFGIPPEKLFYPGRNPERSRECRKMADAIIAVPKGRRMKDYLQALARKGEVTVLEHAGGKTTVALVPFSGAGVVTLQAAASAEQLVKELAVMVRNYPDKEEPRK